MRPSQLIEPDDRLRLERAVLEAERGHPGELVAVVVRACDEYGSVGWRLGVMLAALAFLGLVLFSPPLTPWVYLAFQAAALVLGHALGRIDALRRQLLPETLVEERVAERARRSFAEHGLSRTERRTGILIFVTLLERRVVVLADAGIDAVLNPEESWSEVVDLAVRGLQSGRAIDGLEAAIRRCGEILARHAPAPPTPNELPNALVLED